MKPRNFIARAERAVAFGRHLPPIKLVRRVELSIRRTMRDLWAVPARERPSPRRAISPPRPLFAPRRGMLELDGVGARFTFLGRAETLSILDVDFGALGPEPASQLWRMNLHYMEYLEEVTDPLWKDLVCAWIAANPPERPGAWKDSWNSYALAIRVVVWMQGLAQRTGRLPADAVERAEKSIAKQLRFLERNLEADLGGNHLVKDIKALIWGSAYFAGAEAARWRDSGIKLLRAELSGQILSDGVHFERSPSYHCQVFADLLEIRHVLGGDLLGLELDNVLNRMAQATADLAHPDGRVALFNDAGLDMAYSPAECLDVYQRIFGRRPMPRRIFAFESAGYFGLRTERSYFILDCGRIAPDDLPAHGHGDVLSFELSVGGERIIVDQGVFEYSSGTRRQLSRSASAHNTLCFEGADQADFFGAFRCGRRPSVELISWGPRPDGFVLEGTHDGFGYLPGSPRHIRRFDAKGSLLQIIDRVEGRPDRAASISFLLHPEAIVELRHNAAQISRKGAAVSIASTMPIELEDAVWWPDMGIEKRTRRLRIKVDVGIKEATTTLQVA